MDKVIHVNIVDSLSKLIKDPPDEVLRYLLALATILHDEVTEGSALTILHSDVNSEIFLVDLEIKVPEDMNIIHPNKRVDLVDDMLFFLGGDGGEGNLLDDGGFFGDFVLSFDDVFADLVT